MEKTVDARGLSCPQPVILTMKALEKEKEIKVLVDNETPVQNVTRFASSKGKNVNVKEDGDDFILEIK